MTSQHLLSFAEVKALTGSQVAIAAMCYKSIDADGDPDVEFDVYDQRLMDEAQWPEADDRCACCGARISYACMGVERATMKGFYLGRTCAHHIDGLAAMDSVQAKRLKDRAKSKARIRKLKSDHPRLLPFIEWAEGQEFGSIARDIVSRFADGRKMSFKQARLLVRLKGQSAEHEARKARWAEEKAAAPPLESGRQKVVGTILKVEERENDWGIVWKMTVKLDDGNMLWGTVPRDLEANKGDRVEFTATIEVSDRDEHFGFAKRPSKATTLAFAD
jgi:hypothetical protein